MTEPYFSGESAVFDSPSSWETAPDDRGLRGSGPSLVFQLVHLRKKLTSGTVPTPLPQLSSYAVQDGLFTGLSVRPQGSENAFRRFFQVGRVDPVGLGFADNFFDQIQVPVDVPPDDGVHVGWRFLSLSPTPILLHTGEEARPARGRGWRHNSDPLS